MKEDVTMENNLFKRILQALKEGVVSFLKWTYKNRQQLVFTLLLLMASLYFAYTLGYTTNWALVISDTRGARFFRASQSANRMMANIGFITLVVVLFNMGFGSMKRKKFYVSNIVLSMLSSVLMIVSAVMTLYYNSVLRVMYQNVSEDEVPAYLYETHGAGAKSYLVFDLGNVLSGLMILTGIIVILFVIQKIKAQKERAMLIEKMVTANER